MLISAQFHVRIYGINFSVIIIVSVSCKKYDESLLDCITVSWIPRCTGPKIAFPADGKSAIMLVMAVPINEVTYLASVIRKN
jgi:hypothetical protein